MTVVKRCLRPRAMSLSGPVVRRSATRHGRERVLVLRSPMHANQQAAGLETRLRHAETKLAALTPPRGRGKRQITDEATLVEAIDHVLKDHRVDGLLSVTWEKQSRADTPNTWAGAEARATARSG